jgi:hypothetical protein
VATALVLVAAVVLALLGAWGLARLLARLELSSAERLALTLALLPAGLGLAAFAGLLAGRPGPLLPAALCLVLALLGYVSSPPTPRPPPPQAGEGELDGRAWSGVQDHEGAISPPVHMGVRARSSAGNNVILSLRRISRSGAGLPEILRCARRLAPLRMTGGSRLRSRVPPESRPDRAVDEPAPGSAASRELAPVGLAVVLYAAGALGTTLLTPLSGGALRIGDWVAHWFLVLVYLGEPLPDLRPFTNRVGDFGIISRPPLYNLEGGLLVGALAGPAGQPEPWFWPFQLITPLLALPVIAAGVLWARAIGGLGSARVAAGLLGLSPFLLQNGSYPWSKMVAAGLVLLFLLLIRAAALARRPTRARQTFVLAALCAGLGYLAHQTTIFYVLPTLLWLVWRRPRGLFRRPAAWTLGTWALGGLAGLAAFAPWQGWVLASHGLQATLEANPAWFGADVSDTLGDWLLKGGVAIVGTLVPLPALGALARGTVPSLDQLLRVQLALLTGALGVSGCWLLARSALTSARSRRERGYGPGRLSRLLRRPPWLALVALCGFLGQTMLQPNWHDTGDAAESMTPVVVLGLAYVAREAVRLGPGARRLFFGLVLAEPAVYLGLWLWWAFGPAWPRDPNAVLATRYGLAHLRGLWGPAVPLGTALLAIGLGGSALLLWHALTPSAHQADQARPGRPTCRLQPADERRRGRREGQPAGEPEGGRGQPV